MDDVTLKVPKSMLEELQEKELKKVFKEFEGMDAFYIASVRNFHNIAEQEDVYTTAYVYEKQREITSNIKGKVREYVDKAVQAADELMNEHTVSPETKAVPTDKQERIAYELERQNDMKRWELEFQVADGEALKTMYDRYWGEDDFQALLAVKMKEWESSKGEHRKALGLKVYIESMKTNPAIEQLKKLKNTLKAFKGLDMYPHNLKEGTEAFKLRDINKDLTIPESFNL